LKRLLEIWAGGLPLRAKHGDRFDLDQELRPADATSISLVAGSGSSPSGDKRRSVFVEHVVIALDIAAIAIGSHEDAP
jgi:hypothetical protein